MTQQKISITIFSTATIGCETVFQDDSELGALFGNRSRTKILPNGSITRFVNRAVDCEDEHTGSTGKVSYMCTTLGWLLLRQNRPGGSQAGMKSKFNKICLLERNIKLLIFPDQHGWLFVQQKGDFQILIRSIHPLLEKRLRLFYHPILRDSFIDGCDAAFGCGFYR